MPTDHYHFLYLSTALHQAVFDTAQNRPEYYDGLETDSSIQHAIL